MSEKLKITEMTTHPGVLAILERAEAMRDEMTLTIDACSPEIYKAISIDAIEYAANEARLLSLNVFDGLGSIPAAIAELKEQEGES